MADMPDPQDPLPLGYRSAADDHQAKKEVRERKNRRLVRTGAVTAFVIFGVLGAFLFFQGARFLPAAVVSLLGATLCFLIAQGSSDRKTE